MEIGLIIVIVLLVLAAFDLTVGVANDAVNFVNSAVGSNAAPFKRVLLIAALGVFVGVFFAGGMLEVARKGIFHPDQFTMMELLFIFTAVMFTDVLLLDLFNTYGLPTSTTVSVVFGLLGASIAMTMTKIMNAGGDLGTIVNYINIGSVFKIISAIFISILFAFVFGTVIQYIVRLVFTFDYKSKFKKYGSIWCSITFTGMVLFLFLKGAKNATFMPTDILFWIEHHTLLLSLYLFIAGVIIFQLLISFTKINVLKGIVLFGTFCLAMAFAANDLVNFIGAPFAGFNAYQLAVAQGNNPFAPMTGMTGEIPINIMYLFGAGLIMVFALYTSKKTHRVIKTEVRLGRQEEGYEKYESNALARAMVKISIDIIGFITSIIPEKLRLWVRGRFDLTKYQPEVNKKGQEASFDMLRASVILFVSSILITLATTMKLPLSTTYVTFITAMAAALPDKAWGRESAVYRVSGVITVIGGWFITAMAASLVAFLLTLFINWTGIIGVAILVGLSILAFYSTKMIAKRKTTAEDAQTLVQSKSNVATADSLVNFINETGELLDMVRIAIITSNTGLANTDIDALKKGKHIGKEATDISNRLKYDVMRLLDQIPEHDSEYSYVHTKAMLLIEDISTKTQKLTKAQHKYISNQHHQLLPDQKFELLELTKSVDSIMINTVDMIKHKEFDKVDKLKEDNKTLQKDIKAFSKTQLKRLQTPESIVRRSMFYINILMDIDDILHLAVKIFLNTKKLYKQNIRFKQNP